MDVAGPSQPRSRGSTASSRRQGTYEDDLLRILTDLGPEGTDHIREYYDRRNRQGRQMTDHEVAMSMFLQDARDLEAIEEDRALALELAQHLHLEEEEITPTTRATVPGRTNLPRPLNTPTAVVDPIRPDNNTTNGTQTWGGWFTAIFSGLFGTPQTSTSTVAPATPLARSRPGSPPTTAPARLTGHICVICQDPIHGPEVRAPCGDYYDIPCITDLFQSAMRDESLYPPRCCRQNIPFSQVQPHLSRNLATQFQEKSRELGTLNRVYCARQTCSRFLGPLSETLFGATVYDCSAPNCETRTCARCRGQYDGWMHMCQRDQGAEHVLDLGRTEGWARCPGCSQLIELDMGCYHMTCRCRTEFCYLCKERWKTCGCPQWDERRLFAAAEQRVDVQLGGGRHHHRLHNVQRAGFADPVQPAQPRPQNVQAVQPRAQPANVIQPRAPHTIPAARAPVATPAVRRVAPLPPTLPVQPGASATNLPTNDTTALCVAQSSATQSQHQTNAQSRVRLVQFAQSAEASINTHWRVRPVVPPKPESLVWTMTSSQPGPVVPPKPSSLTPTRRWSSIREQEDWRKTMRPRQHQDTNPPGTNARIMDASSSSASNVGTQNDATRQRLIREMAERLRVDHDCQHTWKYSRGGGRCENCHHAMPSYLFRCVGCEMSVCNRCRKNRL